MAFYATSVSPLVQVLELEEEGKLNLTVRLKKRALQGAYDLALKKKKVEPTSLIIYKRVDHAEDWLASPL